MPVVKVRGIELVLGGETWVVPPLSLGALEQLQPKLKAFTGDVMDGAQLGVVLDVTHAALRRNYPDITRETVGEMIDVGTFMSVFEAVMDVSGVRRKAAEAEKAGAPGEA